MSDGLQKYNPLEPFVQKILSNISLPKDVVDRNNRILKEILDQITTKMRKKDVLFDKMFERCFYGGSYYDGLKVGKPDEYDIDLLLRLPKLLKATLEVSNRRGFVQVRLNGIDTLLKDRTLASSFKDITKLVDEDKVYLVTNKVRSWIEGLISSALREFASPSGGGFVLRTTEGPFHFNIHKGGPAFTIKSISDPHIDIDLVPCFVFGADMWPTRPYRSNPVREKPDFFIVPKPLAMRFGERYWRLSFQEQERVLMNGRYTLKPVVKLLKKLRDTQKHFKMASYYIKTVILKLATEKESVLWRLPVSSTFILALKEYHACLEAGCIQYFWYLNKNNLLQDMHYDTLRNIANRIKCIIDSIDKNLPHNPAIIYDYLLLPGERLENDLTAPEDAPIPQKPSRCVVM